MSRDNDRSVSNWRRPTQFSVFVQMGLCMSLLCQEALEDLFDNIDPRVREQVGNEMKIDFLGSRFPVNPTLDNLSTESFFFLLIQFLQSFDLGGTVSATRIATSNLETLIEKTVDNKQALQPIGFKHSRSTRGYFISQHFPNDSL
jgi:hypothetical protein